MKRELKKIILFVVISSCLLISSLTTIILIRKDSKTKPYWSFNANGDVYSVAISSNGSHFVATTAYNVYFFSIDNFISQWSYECDPTLVLSNNTFFFPSKVAISPDGLYIAATLGKMLFFFSVSTQKPLWNFTSSYRLKSVSISSDGKYIATQDESNIFYFSKSNSSPIWTSNHQLGYSVMSPNGLYIAGFNNRYLYLFSNSSSTPIWKYTLQEIPLRVAVSSNGMHIVLGCYGGKVYLFNKFSSNPKLLFDGDSPSGIYSLEISSDGSLVSVGFRENLYLLNTSNAKLIWKYKTRELGFWLASLSINGTFIVTAVTNPSGWIGFSTTPSTGKIFLFSKKSSNPIWDFNIGTYIYSIAISSDANYTLVGAKKLYLFKNV